jgi:hypothetical protein
MKWQVDEMAYWLNTKLMKWQISEMTFKNGNLKKCQVVRNVKLMKHKVDKMAN